MSESGHDAKEAVTFWRKCSTCKKPIDFRSTYYVCSVSTCNNPRTGYVFCKVGCWESHVPGARHRDAAAVEKIAPTREAYLAQEAAASAVSVAGIAASGASDSRAPARMMATSSSAVVRSAPGSAGSPTGSVGSGSLGARPAAISNEVLVIASRLKEYIDTRSGGYNTSQAVMDVLSNHLRNVCDRGIENARSEGRKTVMDRDFEFLKGR